MKPHTFASIAIGTRFRWVDNPVIGYTHCKTTDNDYTSHSDNDGSTQAPHDLILRSLESTVELADDKSTAPQDRTAKWHWMMDYCKAMGWAPAEGWVHAEQAFKEFGDKPLVCSPADVVKIKRNTPKFSNYQDGMTACVKRIADAATCEINATGAQLSQAFPEKTYVCQEILEEVIRVLQSRV